MTEVYSQMIIPSHPSGRYSESFYLKLDGLKDYHFTSNGSTPSPLSLRFPDSLLVGEILPDNSFCLIPTNAIEYNEKYWRNREFGWRVPEKELEKLHTLRIAGFKAGRKTTDELTLVYQICNDDHYLPIVSIVTDSMNLFDNEIGIYVPGINYNPENPDWSGNYFMKGEQWERPAYFNYFNAEGQSLLNQKIGIRIHGGATRGCPQKTIRLYSHADYGHDSFDYAFFGSDAPSSFKRLLLRSGMCHWFERNTLFQDEFLLSLICDFYPDMDAQKSRPAEMYLNGEHWGLVAVKERIDKHYLAAHYDLDISQIDFIEPTVDRVESFDRILFFCEQNDISEEVNYVHVTECLDIRNFAQYVLLEMFIANLDWPDNNSKAWKSESRGNLWRWILYDLDAGLGKVKAESIQDVLDSDTPIGTLFASLIRNESFVRILQDEWIRMSNNLFTPANMGQKLESFIKQYRPGVEGQAIRWQNPSSISKWEDNINEMYAFLLERPAIFNEQLTEFFSWDEDSLVLPYNINNNWKVYPNPVTDVMYLESEIFLQASWNVQVLDDQGRVLDQFEIQSSELRLPMNNYKAGVYYIRIFSNMYQSHCKIVKY